MIYICTIKTKLLIFIYYIMKTLTIYPNGQIFLTTNGKNEVLTISQANDIFAKTKNVKKYILGEIKFYKFN